MHAAAPARPPATSQEHEKEETVKQHTKSSTMGAKPESAEDVPSHSDAAQARRQKAPPSCPRRSRPPKGSTVQDADTAPCATRLAPRRG